MISRIDNENLYYMESDGRRRSGTRPGCSRSRSIAWQVIQIGNCGSPIETEAGWLLMTHGVGPMRQYCIGATLLDRDDPCRSSARPASRSSCPTEECAVVGLCPQRRVLVRGDDPQPEAHPSLCHQRPDDRSGPDRPR